jgi:hypothetical protein
VTNESCRIDSTHIPEGAFSRTIGSSALRVPHHSELSHEQFAPYYSVHCIVSTIVWCIELYIVQCVHCTVYIVW